MGKHNGKARKTGIRVGTALANKARREGRVMGAAPGEGQHTTAGPNINSVLEASDLVEFMDMAALADKEFDGEKSRVVVLSSSVQDAKAQERDMAARRLAEQRHEHRLRIPRRPAWSANTTPEQLDASERAAFLAWRRELACVEEEELLVLTPFEKNLEMWRQLWRVLERSDLVVQVVDARDPLFYRSHDLEAYARSLADNKASLLLLNKADLLTPAQRAAWADYFDADGVQYLWWSAKAAIEAAAAEKAGEDLPAGRVAREGEQGGDGRTRLLGVDELLDVLEARARQALCEAADGNQEEGNRRVVVGLTGYPNVGKSSTINALYGSKKTAVAPTPGKTKHFQTINVTRCLCLCDCPGLVLPRFAASKADMVAAGVLPIDRLTDVRGPVEVLAQRVPRQQLEAAYTLRLPPPQPHERPDRPATAPELLRSLALARGWVVGNGLPDEARAGRQLLRDYCAGKLVYARWPPGMEPRCPQQEAAAASSQAGPSGRAAEAGMAVVARGSDVPTATWESHADAAKGGLAVCEAGQSEVAGGSNDGGVVAGGREDEPLETGGSRVQLSAADCDVMNDLQLGGSTATPRRPDYKFKKKPARGKGDRGQARDEGAYDGRPLQTGKKGGLMRVGVY